ncbi:hypothetical protein ACHQM5_010532 [Ranunculus cassubicifolius]
MASDSETEKSGHKKIQALAPIAKPLAGKKLSKKTLKLVRRLLRASDAVAKDSVLLLETFLRLMLSHMTHLLLSCEEAEIPYIHSKEDLATAGATKKPTCCVLVLTKLNKGELAEEEQEKLKADYNQVVLDVVEITRGLF